jgi:hypothetical protein
MQWAVAERLIGVVVCCQLPTTPGPKGRSHRGPEPTHALLTFLQASSRCLMLAAVDHADVSGLVAWMMALCMPSATC